MVPRWLPLVFLAVLLPLAPAQQAPVGQTSAFDAEALVREINSFYIDYWKVWDEHDPEGIAARLEPDFVAFAYSAPRGVVQVEKAAAVAGLHRFFDAVGDREAAWGRSLLSVVPRSATEAIAAVRSDFSLKDAGSEVELTLDVLRKAPDGRWRLVRRWSEKHTF